MTLKIKFPTYSDIRELKLTLEEAADLAKCFISWDKGDHWPGGFTAGSEFTPEYVMQRFMKQLKFLGQYVIDNQLKQQDDSIGFLGYVNLAQHKDTDAYYIPLLGVNPDFHGHGYGKSMLLSCLQRSIVDGKRRLDLNTWSGNLKAVPLYKKVGFFWHPKTEVLMTNFLPAVLGSEFLSPFFSKHDWYTTRKVDITQAEDILEEDDQFIYRYYFEEETDRLIATIDREAKELSGIDLTFDGLDLEIQLQCLPNRGYKGIDQPAIILLINNRADKSLDIQINPIDGPEASYSTNEIPDQVVISSNQSVRFESNLQISNIVETRNLEVSPSHRTLIRVTCELVINGMSLVLGAGMRIQDAFILTKHGFHSSPQLPQQTFTITNKYMDFSGALSVLLNEKEILTQSLVISNEEMLDVPIEIPVEFISETRINEFKFIIHNASSKVELPYNVSNFINDIPMAYKVNKGYLIENRAIRVSFHCDEDIYLNWFFNKNHDISTSVYRSMLSIGLPYPTTTSEYWIEPMDVEILQLPDRVQLIFTKTSKIDHPGLIVKSIYEIQSGKEFFTYYFEISSKTSSFDKLAIETTTIGNFFENGDFRGYFPTADGLFSDKELHISYRDFLQESTKYFSENWWVGENSRQILGVVWDDGFAKIRASRASCPTLETPLFEISPSKSYVSPKYRIVLSKGDYTIVRKVYAKEVANLPFEELPRFRPKSINRIAASQLFLPEQLGGKDILMGNKDGSIQFQTYRKSAVKYNGKFTMQDQVLVGEFQPKHGSPMNLNMKSERVIDCIEGIISSGLFSRRISGVSLNPLGNAEVSQHTINGFETIQLTNNFINLTVVPTYSGSITSLKFNGKEMIESRFPSNEPFIWFSKFPGGIFTSYVPRYIWSTKLALSVEFTHRIITEEFWTGIVLEAKPNWESGVRQTTQKVSYWLHHGLPLVIIDLQIENQSKSTRSLRSELAIVPNPDSEIFVSNKGKILKYAYTLIEYSNMVNSGWFATSSKDSNKYMGIFNLDDKSELGYYDAGQQLTYISSIIENIVKPNKSMNIRLLLALSDNLAFLKALGGAIYQTSYPVYLE
ncbi:MAG: GNAT family N-acetyltransferase [Candidatus Heimdallarchaeota archaeon]|nr:GNAT family N-acetyltransferase [Candidatus Heimdallarchaeota archaeon]MDH5644497.1 GNAT family N-acetyltransferase [Candidatus Heimdallarchaeota archaeon]